MYIRFVAGTDSDYHRTLTGIITEALLLRERNALDHNQEALLEEFYAWFNANLPVPPASVWRWHKFGVAWFKDTATEPIGKMWDLVALLREQGVPVRLLRSANPGKIVYEDDFQVVVEEWNVLQ